MHLNRHEAATVASTLGILARLVDDAEQDRRDREQLAQIERQEQVAMRKELEARDRDLRKASKLKEEHKAYAEQATKLHDLNKTRANYIANTAQNAIDKLRGADEKFDAVKGLLQNIKATAIELKEDDGDS